MADRVRRQRRLRRDRAEAPATGSVLELNGHSVEQVDTRPRPTWAWSQTIPLAVAPEATAQLAQVRTPQEVHANGTPSWAWHADAPAIAPVVVFADPLVVADQPPPPVRPAPAPAAPPPGRRLPKRGLLLASPALAVIAILAVLAGAGVLRLPGSSDGSGSISAIHASQPQGLNGLAPSTVAPPLAIAPAPVAPILPAQRPPVTGGGGALLPDGLLDNGAVSVPRVVHAAARPALPLPPPLRAERGGAAADASALTGTIGAPDAGPVSLGPVAPASATAGSKRASASDGSALAGCGDAAASACPSDQIRSLSSEATSAIATVERGPAPDCSPANGGQASPPMAGACTQAIHLEMLPADPALAVVADGVSSSSLTSGCPVVTEGRSTVGELVIGGVRVAGGPGALIPTSSPQPNTTVALAAGTVVLNEQRLDRGGRGLTVNAVHLLAPATLFSPFSLDMVIGHSHSAALPASGCAAAPVTAADTPHDPVPVLAPATPEAVLPDVIQIRHVLRGMISL
ncbi:MAG TPA: choice-of-anchor P family protein [Candidatus Dormibacteraeota bacterium]|nr:choice-of-anchor P family protein [Candidatus Dormibacteraeota bacterium]